jgi:hypothetical protein
MYQKKQVVLLLVIFCVFLGSLFALPKKALDTSQGKVFDPSKIEVLRGTVARVDSLRPMMKLLLDTDREEIGVQVGPSWYILKSNFPFYPGDYITVTGSRVMIDGEPTLIAMEIKKNGRFLKLRDAEGKPLWGNPDTWNN